MFGIHDLSLFILSGLLLNVLPGPDSLFIVSRSLAHGWRAGCVAALGIGSGVIVHVLAAAFGLSALLATSATAFTVIKMAGAAYLLYLGVMALRSRAASADSQPLVANQAGVPAVSLSRLFVQGWLTNVLNPKVALFFLAFVPQFIDPASAHKALAFVLLGMIFNLNGTLWCLLLALGSGLLGRKVRLAQSWVQRLNRLVGVLFVGLGVRLALSAR